MRVLGGRRRSDGGQASRRGPLPSVRPRRSPRSRLRREGSRRTAGPVRTSAYAAQTVLPGPSGRRFQSQRAARWDTRSSPQPVSSVPVAAGSAGRLGRRSARVSVTSTRTVPEPGTTWRRKWKSRPATRPCRTAFEVSSATISRMSSCGPVPYGTPHASSRTAASLRARRAPRGEEVKRISKMWPSARSSWTADGKGAMGAVGPPATPPPSSRAGRRGSQARLCRTRGGRGRGRRTPAADRGARHGTGTAPRAMATCRSLAIGIPLRLAGSANITTPGTPAGRSPCPGSRDHEQDIMTLYRSPVLWPSPGEL